MFNACEGAACKPAQPYFDAFTSLNVMFLDQTLFISHLVSKASSSSEIVSRRMLRESRRPASQDCMFTWYKEVHEF